jgi:hypothetical protein
MRIFFSGLASKRLLVFVFFLFLAGMVFAVDFTPPHFIGNDPSIEELNEKARRIFMEYEDLINSKLAFLPSNVPNLAGAFANTSVFSSSGASQRGYEGYKMFSLTAGFMGALQFPRKFTLLDEIMNVMKDGEGEAGFDLDRNDLDIGIGLDIQAFNVQLGINTSFLLKNLYLGFKFSTFDSNWIKTLPSSDIYFKTMSFGITAKYQLINQINMFGLLVWRGLNLGTGFIWQNTSLGFTTSLFPEEDLKNFPIETQIETIGTINMQFDETFRLGINTNTIIIPVEAMTSIRLFWFLNLALGVGVDIAFGSSNISARGSFDVSDVSGLPDDVIMDVPPSLSYSLGGKSAPSVFNLKAMGAVGFNFGPIIIDIPFTYYFVDNGYSLGITFGLTF